LSQSIGLIGLAAMGENLALNIERHGFSVAVFNRSAERTQEFVQGRASGTRIIGAESITDFVALIERPRRVVLMVKAGAPVDEVIGQLIPVLAPGDLVIDGGNSHFRDTERRGTELSTAGLLYLGTGISGGEEGALNGPSIMPGGPLEAYRLAQPVLEAIAARVNGEPCVAYMGPRGAGHYVKMVHNAIEYADMQLISEAYDILHRGLGLESESLAETFAEWNRGDLASYLIEITADIFRVVDPETGAPLVDLVLDQAEQKGTGKWASQNAFDVGAPIPSIDASVEARVLSSFKAERIGASQLLPGPEARIDGDRAAWIRAVGDALFAAKVCTYAQGMALLRMASREYGYALRLADIARIWRGGCIIRARFLGRMQAAFREEPDLPNLLLDRRFGEVVVSRQAGWRRVVQAAVGVGIPCPAISASLAYFDAVRSARLPANLIQAQRDCFGAHTYRRTDRDGVFHSEWRPLR
jgi:6-phosphogluconate dehydrogenase